MRVIKSNDVFGFTAQPAFRIESYLGVDLEISAWVAFGDVRAFGDVANCDAVGRPEAAYQKAAAFLRIGRFGEVNDAPE